MIGDATPALARKIMIWRHNTGFSVHNGVRIGANDAKGRLSLAQYIIRTPPSPWRSGAPIPSRHGDLPLSHTHGKGRPNFLAVPASEFIARIAQHIPDKGFQVVSVANNRMARYYGWYSNRSRGERAKAAQEYPAAIPTTEEAAPQIIDIRAHRPRCIPSPVWRECIKRVWEVDPLTCSRCGAEMKIISFITEAQVGRHILEHLGKWRVRRKPSQGHFAANWRIHAKSGSCSLK